MLEKWSDMESMQAIETETTKGKEGGRKERTHWERERRKYTQARASQVALMVKNPPAKAGDVRCGFDSWVRKTSWRRAWQPTPVFLPGESSDRGTWWTVVHRVTKSWTHLKRPNTCGKHASYIEKERKGRREGGKKRVRKKKIYTT